MKAIERLHEYLKYKEIKPTRFEKKIGLSNGYPGTQLKRNADLGESIMGKIIDYCLDINPTWLLTGTGEMLKKQEKTAVNQSIPGNNNKNNQLAGGNINSHFQSEIDDLKKTVSRKRQNYQQPGQTAGKANK